MKTTFDRAILFCFVLPKMLFWGIRFSWHWRPRLRHVNLPNQFFKAYREHSHHCHRESKYILYIYISFIFPTFHRWRRWLHSGCRSGIDVDETCVNSEHRTFSKSSEGPRISRRRVLAPTGTHRTELEGRSCTCLLHHQDLSTRTWAWSGWCVWKIPGQPRQPGHAAPAWRSDDWSLLHHPVVNLEASSANRKACSDPPVTRRQNGQCIKVSVQGWATWGTTS